MAERHDTLVMLRLREITITDLGNYTCEAENTQGTARDHIELSGKHLLKIFSQFRNLHFLSENSTLISRENCRFFWGGEKLVKMLWFWTF